jgi:hypothetical protein
MLTVQTWLLMPWIMRLSCYRENWTLHSLLLDSMLVEMFVIFSYVWTDGLIEYFGKSKIVDECGNGVGMLKLCLARKDELCDALLAGIQKP